MIDRLVTPYSRENKPRPLIVPTMDEEIFARNRFGDGRDWHTVEGATYFAYRDRAFITYSANAYEHETTSSDTRTHSCRISSRRPHRSARLDETAQREPLRSAAYPQPKG